MSTDASAVLSRATTRGRRRTVPFVQSLTASDCGAACVAMVSALHGRPLGLTQAREALRTNRDGTSVRGMLEGARRLGLRARPLRIEMDGLAVLEPGTILFWSFNHFVVFERQRGTTTTIVDPSLGRRELPRDVVDKNLTGLAIALEPGETFHALETRTKSQGRIARSLGRTSATLLWTAALSVILQLLLLAVPSATGIVIDTLVPTRDHAMLTWLVAGAAMLPLLVALGEYCRQNMLVVLRSFLEVDLSLGLVSHLLRLPLSFFQVRQTGDLLTRLGSIAFIRQVASSTAVSALLDGSLVLLYFTIIFATSPLLGAVATAFVLARVVLFALTRRRQRALTSEELEKQALLRGFQVEMLNGIESVKSSANEPWVEEQWTNLFVDTFNVSVRRERLDALVSAVRRALDVGGPLAVLLFGAHLVMTDRLSLGTMYTVVALTSVVFLPVDQLCQAGIEITKLRSHVDRIDDVFAAEPEQSAARPRQTDALTGAIALDRVSFGYDVAGPPVVKEVTLAIAPRQTVAIVGRTGCGKSTLAKLLLGLYTPTSGRVLYDGVDLATVDVSSIREQIGAVPQQPMMLDGTIRENIAPGGDRSFEEVVRAAKIAQVHTEIMAMPMRYETRALTGGSSFSGGQRQRIAVARAIAREPAIMVLDEATSSLDTVTEARVHAQLTALPMTLVIIAHRLSTVRCADLICVMDGGQIVERGNHEELLARRGYYFELVKHQLAGEGEERPALERAS